MADVSSLLAELPGFVRELVLGHWPKTEVEPMRRCGDAHMQLCQALNSSADQYDAEARQAEAAVEGNTRGGLATRHRAVAQAMRDQAAVHHSFGLQFYGTADATLSTEHLLIVAGMTLAAQVSYDVLLFYQGGGFKALADRAEAEAAMRAAARQLPVEVGERVAAGTAQRVALHGAIHAAKIGAMFGAVTSAGAQAWDLIDGNRKTFDVGAFLEQVAGGALGGAVGAEVGRRIAPGVLGKLTGNGASNLSRLTSHIGGTMIIGGAGGLFGGVAGAIPALVLHHEDIHSLGDLFKAVRDSAITGFGGGFVGAASGSLRVHKAGADAHRSAAHQREFSTHIDELLRSGRPPRIERVTRAGTLDSPPESVQRLTFHDGTRVIHTVVDNPQQVIQAARARTTTGAPAVHVVGNHMFTEIAPGRSADGTASHTNTNQNRQRAEQLSRTVEGTRRQPPERGVFVPARGDRPVSLGEDPRAGVSRMPGNARPAGDGGISAPGGHGPEHYRVPEPIARAHSDLGEPPVPGHPDSPANPAGEHAPGEGSVGLITARHEDPNGESASEPEPPHEPDPFDDDADEYALRLITASAGSGHSDDIPPPDPPEGMNFEDGDPPNESDRELAAHALSRLPGAGESSAESAAELLRPLDRSAYLDDHASPEDFAAHGRAQALNNLAWWRGLTDESIPDGLRAQVAQERFENSGYGLSRLQRALLRTHPELLTRALGIPDDVSTQASLRVLKARMQALIDKAASGSNFTGDELLEYFRTPSLIDCITMDIDGVPHYLRDLDPVTGEAAFVFGNAATAAKRIYVVTPIHPNTFTIDYHENWLTAKRLYQEMQRMQPGADVAVVGWVRGTGGDNASGDALRGPLLRRDIAVGNAIYQQHRGVDPDLAAAGIELDVVAGHDVITFDHASAAAYAALGEDGLHTIYTINPAESHGPSAPPHDVSMYTTYSRKEDPPETLALHGGQRLAAVDGTYRPAAPDAGEANPLLRVMARIGLGRDVSRYVPELSDHFGNLVPDGQNLPRGNRALVDLGADDVFRVPDGPIAWTALEGSVGGRLVPVAELGPGRSDPVDQLISDLRTGVARDDHGGIIPDATADTYTVVLDNGTTAYRIEMTKVGEDVIVFDPLVGGPMEVGRWQELRLHPTIDKAWVIAHSIDGDGVLRPIDSTLHDPKVAHPAMPSHLIGSEGVHAPHAERVSGKLTVSFGIVSRTFPMSIGGEVLIGRSAAGSSMLEPFSSVSRNHARVGVLRDGRLWIADSGSSKGTFVNGERLAPDEMRVIGPNDTIRLGHDFETSISFLPNRPLPDSHPPVEPVGPPKPAEPPRPVEPPPMPAQPPQPMLGFGDTADPIPLIPGEMIKLGRAGDPRLPSALRENPYVSSNHAFMWIDSQGHGWIRDIGSTNGTFVNGERINPYENVRVQHGDRILLGHTYETELRLPHAAAEIPAALHPAFIRSPNDDGPPLRLDPGSEFPLGRQDSPLATRLGAFTDVSRRHATIGMTENGRAWIRDEGSSNGTFVNGKRIPHGYKVPLNGEVQIRLGFEYQLTANFDPPNPPNK
ncbi:FHA domain-containing protein [Nocardia sp. CA-119907]|uniref:FHA domain-containing protein n=1 Tax=Nocardia sp. CA-119907 TaxID=3239973 RepID=UPI003D978E79